MFFAICDSPFLLNQIVEKSDIGSNTDSTVFHKKGFDGVATTERYSTVPFPKEAASLFIKDKDKALF